MVQALFLAGYLRGGGRFTSHKDLRQSLCDLGLLKRGWHRSRSTGGPERVASRKFWCSDFGGEFLG